MGARELRVREAETREGKGGEEGDKMVILRY